EAAELLARATSLLPNDHESRLELECLLGMAHKFCGNGAGALALLREVEQQSVAAGNTRIEHLARVEQVWSRLERGELSPDDVLELLDRARDAFEQAGDDFALGRAWHVTSTVKAVYQFRYAELETAASRIRYHYERSGVAVGTVVFLLAAAACRGPTP